MDFSERSHSIGEARAVPSTSVHNKIQEGLRSLFTVNIFTILQMENRPGGGRGTTGLGPSCTVAEQMPQPSAYTSPGFAHPQSSLQHQ